MSGRWTRRWASCLHGRNRAQAKRRRRDRRMRASSGAMLRMRGRVGEASAKALAGGKAARGRTARGEAAGLSGGRSLPYNDSSERRGILPHRTEKRKSMREGFRAGAFFCARKGRARGKGQEKREAGLWCGFVQIGKMYGWRQKEGTGSGCGPAEKRASGWVGGGVRKRRERRKAERGGGCAAAWGKSEWMQKTSVSQVAADCRRLQQVAADCSRLPQIVTSCRRL